MNEGKIMTGAEFHFKNNQGKMQRASMLSDQELRKWCIEQAVMSNTPDVMRSAKDFHDFILNQKEEMPMTKKALNFDDAAIHDDEPRKIPNSGDVKKFIERIHKVEETMDQAKADLKGLYADAKDQGMDPKALKVVVKHKKNPVSTEHRQEVNVLLDKMGDLPLFAF